jgi:virginiamycin B lyase
MIRRSIIVSTLFVMLLAACGPSASPTPGLEPQGVAQQPSDTPTPAAVLPTHTPVLGPTNTSQPTDAPLPEPTETPAPELTATPLPVANETEEPTDTPAPTPTPESAMCDGTPTPAQAEGPYYTPNTPERANLVEAGMGGTPLLVIGKVLNQNCEPIAGAMLDFWQTDDNGEYDNVGYRMRGHQFADENGSYALETILPVRYPGRPPHIHVKVNAPNGPVLTTQIYFEGQPGNEDDGLILPSLIVPLLDAAGGGKAANFNFVLVSEQAEATSVLEEYSIPPGSRPHDVAPAPDGAVWYTAQGSGELGRLDPATGETHHIALGQGSAPHGVIVGPDGAPWVTDGGLNAIVRVDPATEEVQSFALPEGAGYANLNTATFDHNGVLWFTGQSGIYGRLDPAVEQVEVFDAPRGRGPYGISTTPDGVVYYASLAGSYIARLNLETGAATVLEPPTPGQGARRVWPDSQGRVWVSEWNGGQVALYDPATDGWREWRLSGDSPLPYAVYVDEQDMVWLSDFGANALVRFDPLQETLEAFTLPSPGANVRQLLGRSGEVWGAESGTDKLVVIRTR